jgi:hypothetical protein
MRFRYALAISGVLTLAVSIASLALTPPDSYAHAPYRPATPWYGARAVQWNQGNGVQYPDGNTKTIGVFDRYNGGSPGLSSAITNSSFYADASWNWGDNLHTWVTKETVSAADGTAIYIYSWPGDVYCHDPPEPCTHIHLFSVGEADGIYGPDDALRFGPAYVGDIHLTAATVASGSNSAATIIAHEVGHALGLEDEGLGHGGNPPTLMVSPSPGTVQSSAADRRTEEWCIPIYFYYPC